jgi:hypothetical protein
MLIEEEYWEAKGHRSLRPGLKAAPDERREPIDSNRRRVLPR